MAEKVNYVNAHKKRNIVELSSVRSRIRFPISPSLPFQFLSIPPPSSLPVTCLSISPSSLCGTFTTYLKRTKDFYIKSRSRTFSKLYISLSVHAHHVCVRKYRTKKKKKKKEYFRTFNVRFRQYENRFLIFVRITIRLLLELS